MRYLGTKEMRGNCCGLQVLFTVEILFFRGKEYIDPCGCIVKRQTPSISMQDISQFSYCICWDNKLPGRSKNKKATHKPDESVWMNQKIRYQGPPCAVHTHISSMCRLGIYA